MKYSKKSSCIKSEPLVVKNQYIIIYIISVYINIYIYISPMLLFYNPQNYFTLKLPELKYQDVVIYRFK